MAMMANHQNGSPNRVIPDHTATVTNIMAKGITYFAGGQMAGLVVGGKAPLVVGSRADPPQTRLVCIAAGALIAAWYSLAQDAARLRVPQQRGRNQSQKA